jgi:phage terminase Nu1 subunit (DNA packaging protein)
MLERDVIQAGQTLREWLAVYLDHLRAEAAGRDPGGQLAVNRADLALVQKELAQHKLATLRRQNRPVLELEMVIAKVGRQIASVLEPLPGEIRKVCPEFNAEASKKLQEMLSRARNLAADMSLAALEEDEADVLDDPQDASSLEDDAA